MSIPTKQTNGTWGAVGPTQTSPRAATARNHNSSGSSVVITGDSSSMGSIIIESKNRFFPKLKAANFSRLFAVKMEKEDGSTERKRIEMVRDTLQQFMEERKLNSANGNKESEMEEDLLLSRLLSKLDSVETTSELNDSALAIPVNKHEKCSDPTSTSSENKKEDVTDFKEIAKDLKIIKRQNRITHNLLSALIVVTMIWQFGEVSVILAMREKITNPVKSIGDMIKNAFTRKGKESLIESPAFPPTIGVPEPNGSFPLLITK